MDLLVRIFFAVITGVLFCVLLYHCIRFAVTIKEEDCDLVKWYSPFHAKIDSVDIIIQNDIVYIKYFDIVENKDISLTLPKD